METKEQLLHTYFGYTAFRVGQDRLIDAVLAGRDAFGIMPTGGGKSICYQIPALMLEGVTLVISPLISLMKDQVVSLRAAGIPAAYINSSLSFEQIRKVCDCLRAGKYKLVYIAPERLLSEEFLRVLSAVRVSFVAVDEAHCISQWGQDFRPSYLKIVDFIDRLPRRPVFAAFTATATDRVREDVEKILRLRDPLRVITGFDRPNLRFSVEEPKNKQQMLLALLDERKKKSGIIYCSTRKQADTLCDLLSEKGFAVTKYHAGLPEAERRVRQDDFVYDRARIMVATNAFGMGIDKSNVSFVIHYNMPKSLEEYYQEAGRAGRDGGAADCILLFSPGDIFTARFLIENASENENAPDEERTETVRHGMHLLNSMVGYCKTTRCLRSYILDYFGQSHDERCGNCGNCDASITEKDITNEAKMILSCVQRIYRHLGYAVGAALAVQVLRGSRSKRITELSLDRLSTYGLMRSYARQTVCRMIDALQEQGLLAVNPTYGTLVLTERSRAVLFNGQQVYMQVKEAAINKDTVPPDRQPDSVQTQKSESADLPASKRQRSSVLASTVPSIHASELYEELKSLRTEIAERENVPAYIVFSNAALQEMSIKMPKTKSEFLKISGVGNVKAEKYGAAFLERIRMFLSAL